MIRLVVDHFRVAPGQGITFQVKYLMIIDVRNGDLRDFLAIWDKVLASFPRIPEAPTLFDTIIDAVRRVPSALFIMQTIDEIADFKPFDHIRYV